jgi:hypothetical protein
MTEPTPRTDAVWENTPGPSTNILNEMREYSMLLERQCARQSELIWELWKELLPPTKKRWKERIERELKG